MPIIEARASVIAGTPVTIQCNLPDDGPIDGYTHFYVWTDPETGVVERVAMADSIIQLKPSLCLILRQPAPYYEPAAGEAFLALTHEAMHIREVSMNEAHVETLALGNIWQTVRQWKFPARVARLILEQAVGADALLPANYHQEPQ